MTALIKIDAAEGPALERLLSKARAEGVRLFRDRTDGRHYASSTSKLGSKHYVTGYSCDCQGFATHGRCKHHAALLSAFGWIGTQNATPTPQPCPDCDGRGFHIKARQVETGRFVRQDQPCPRCHGDGIEASFVA